MGYNNDIMDRLVVNPDQTLAFDRNGNEVWRKREKLAERLSLDVEREIIRNKYGMDSDELLVWVLRLNPGLEIQLRNCCGQFPYVVMYANGYEDIIVPEGVYTSDGALCCSRNINYQQIKLAEICLD